MTPYIHFLLLIYCNDRKELLRYAISVDANDPRLASDSSYALLYWAEPAYSKRLLNLLPEQDASPSHVLVDAQRIDGAVQWGRINVQDMQECK